MYAWIQRGPFLQYRLDVRLGLLERDPVLQPADQIQEVSATIPGTRGIESERQPDLDLLIVDVVAGRHDRNNPRRNAVDRNDAPEDGFVAAKRASPDLTRQRPHIFGAGERIGARELPAPHRRDTENRHQLGRDHRRYDTSRLIGRSKVHGSGPIRADIVEALVPLAKLDEFRGGDPELIETKPRKLARDEHES